MFCGECGAKLKKNARFCGECGAKVSEASEKQEEKPTKVVHKTEKKPMSTSKKVLIIVVLLLIVGGIIGYNVMASKLGPEGVAKSYIEALKTNNAGEIYESLGLDGDTTFASKEMFQSIFENDENNLSNITNYTISDVIYSDGNLAATVQFKVTRKDSSEEETVNVNVVKKSDKKFLIFDEWEVTKDSVSALGVDLVENYQVRVPKNAKVTINDIELEQKYLNADYSDEEEDVYVIPQIFEMTATIKTTLENGLEITDEEEISSYDVAYTAEVSLENLSEDTRNKLKEQMTNDINKMYENIIAKKNWDAVKDSYNYEGADLKDLQEEYNSLYERIVENATNTLTKFNVTDLTVSRVRLNDGGQLEVTAKFDYDYTISYDSNDQTQTKEDDSSNTTTITYDYKDNSYKIIDISGTVKYFSRY